ncbi:MAG: peptidoglycan recognition family protein [Patescibacteria group bacterium]
MNIIQKPSPNFWSGRKGYRPEAVVIHIMDGTLVGTDSWFATPTSQVSAHYGVGRGGEIHQYVQEGDTAWHAGRVDKPSWKLIKPDTNPNLYTIGIEHEGKPNDVWIDAMKQTSANLIREICKRWQIPIDRQHIIGHYQIFSQKPNCPATSKSIIDELIALASDQQAQDATIESGIKKIEEGLAIIKKFI